MCTKLSLKRHCIHRLFTWDDFTTTTIYFTLVTGILYVNSLECFAIIKTSIIESINYLNSATLPPPKATHMEKHTYVHT